MNRKRMIIILIIFVILIVGGIFLLGQKADRKSNESGSINNKVTQENDAEEQDVKENDMQEENELPIISPSSDGQSTSDFSNNTDNSEEEPSETVEDENSEEVPEDTSELDDNLDMELPFVPAT